MQKKKIKIKRKNKKQGEKEERTKAETNTCFISEFLDCSIAWCTTNMYTRGT